MSLNDELFRSKASMQAPLLTERILVAIILALFLLLHVLAGMILERSATADGPSVEQDARQQLYD